MDPNNNQPIDPNTNQIGMSQDPINPYAPTNPQEDAITENPINQIAQLPPETEMIPAPEDDMMVTEPQATEMPPIESTLPTIPQPPIKNPLQSLTIAETPEGVSITEKGPVETPSIMPTPPVIPPTPTTPEPTETKVLSNNPMIGGEVAAEAPKTGSNSFRYVLIAIALILVGILIGVLASNIVPQNVIVPTSPTPTLTPEISLSPTELITPEASPTAILTKADQSIIEKFAGKKTTGGITPDLIQKCNYKDASVYTMTNTSVVASPSIVVDANGKYVMTCGVESKNCSLVSMCQEIWKASPKTSYVCPTGEWVDCMPSVGGSTKIECSQDYLQWAKANCAGFKGAAL